MPPDSMISQLGIPEESPKVKETADIVALEISIESDFSDLADFVNKAIDDLGGRSVEVLDTVVTKALINIPSKRELQMLKEAEANSLVNSTPKAINWKSFSGCHNIW
jgi:hypothetical protein